MKNIKPVPPQHVIDALKALKRASRLARKLSQATDTPFIYTRNGKIVKEIIAKSWCLTNQQSLIRSKRLDV